MNFEIKSNLSANQFVMWRNLIESAGLVADECASRTVLVFDGEELVATGGRDGCVLKLIAVANNHKGEDLTASVLSELRRDAFADGHSHLFLYTKPKNRHIFESLFFYPVVETEDVLVMENKQRGIAAFLDTLPQPPQSTDVGAIVMNCNPFTFGHRSLIERAAAECAHVFVFILSEDKSEFSAADRLEMARLGTAHIPNVTVLPSGPYLISSATFPTYFLKDRDKAKQALCDVDIEIFVKYLAPRLNITRRYVGTEPLSQLTADYNAALGKKLPCAGIELHEIKRVSTKGVPISASFARELIKNGDTNTLSHFVPSSTLNYLREKNHL